MLTPSEAGPVTRAERAEAELARVRADRDRLRDALRDVVIAGITGYFRDKAWQRAEAALRESEAGT